MASRAPPLAVSRENYAYLDSGSLHSPRNHRQASIARPSFLHSESGIVCPCLLRLNIGGKFSRLNYGVELTRLKIGKKRTQFSIGKKLTQEDIGEKLEKRVAIFAQKRQGNRRKQRKIKENGPERMVKLIGTATAAVFSSAILAVTAAPLIAVTLSMLALLPVAATVLASVLLPLGIAAAVLSNFGILQVTVLPNLHLSQFFFPWLDKVTCVILLFNFLGGAISLWGQLMKGKHQASRGELAEANAESLSWGLPTVVSFIPGISGVAWLLPLSESADGLPILRRAIFTKNAVLYGLPSFFHFVQFFTSTTSNSFWGVSQLHAWWLAIVLGAIHLQMEKIRMDEEIGELVDMRETNGWNGRSKKQALSDDEEEVLRQSSELEYFDTLLRQRAGTSFSDSLEDWSTGDVVEWLKQQGFARYASVFLDQDVDGPLLEQLTAEELRDELGMSSLGDRKRFLSAVMKLKKQLK